MSKPLNTVNLIQRRLIKKHVHPHQHHNTSSNTSSSLNALSPTTNIKPRHIPKDTSQTSLQSIPYLNTNTNLPSTSTLKSNPYKSSSFKIPCKFKQMVQEMISVKKAYESTSQTSRHKPSIHRRQSSCNSDSNNYSYNYTNKNNLNYIFTNRFENPLKSARVKHDNICMKCKKRGNIYIEDTNKQRNKKKSNDEIQEYIQTRLFSPSPYRKKYVITRLSTSTSRVRTRKASVQGEQPRLYKGPIDIQMMFSCSNGRVLMEKVLNLLKKWRIAYSKIHLFKYHCSKNGDSFNLEVCTVGWDVRRMFVVCIKMKKGSVEENHQGFIKELVNF